MALNPNSKRAALHAVKRLAGAPEWAELIRVYRAELGGDGNTDDLVDYLFMELQKQYLNNVTPLREMHDKADGR